MSWQCAPLPFHDIAHKLVGFCESGGMPVCTCELVLRHQPLLMVRRQFFFDSHHVFEYLDGLRDAAVFEVCKREFVLEG